MRLINQKGDTIVEVLIAISVLAFAIGTGYATVNESNKSVLANKERYQAQLLANQQVEYLREYVNQNVENVRSLLENGVANNRCLKPNSLNLSKIDNTLVTALNNNECDFSSDVYGATYKIKNNFLGSCTNLSIYCDYKIEVVWDSVKGSQERLEVYYGL
jgi:type II secretory pathway pseudopilin PulG